MEWTRTPPTREGWYWVYSLEFPTVAIVVCWRGTSGKLLAVEVGTGKFVDADSYAAYWQGPLEEPEPPKVET